MIPTITSNFAFHARRFCIELRSSTPKNSHILRKCVFWEKPRGELLAKRSFLIYTPFPTLCTSFGILRVIYRIWFSRAIFTRASLAQHILRSLFYLAPSLFANNRALCVKLRRARLKRSREPNALRNVDNNINQECCVRAFQSNRARDRRSQSIPITWQRSRNFTCHAIPSYDGIS